MLRKHDGWGCDSGEGVARGHGWNVRRKGRGVRPSPYSPVPTELDDVTLEAKLESEACSESEPWFGLEG